MIFCGFWLLFGKWMWILLYFFIIELIKDFLELVRDLCRLGEIGIFILEFLVVFLGIGRI